jgi:hypothetical protein
MDYPTLGVCMQKVRQHKHFAVFYRTCVVGIFCFCLNSVPALPCYGLQPHARTHINKEPGVNALSIDWDKNLLSVIVDNVSLATVLKKISNETGISIFYYGSAVEPVSAILSNLTVEDAVKRLAGAKGYAFIYEGKGAGKAFLIPIEVYIYFESASRHDINSRTIADTAMPYSESPAPDVENADVAPEMAVNEYADENEDQFASQVDLALNDRALEIRITSIEFLASSGQHQAVDTLIQTLQDPEPRIRVASVQALGQYNGQRPVEALKTALQDPAPAVRQAAMLVLNDMDKGESAEDNSEKWK